jgi:hypothetical protein
VHREILLTEVHHKETVGEMVLHLINLVVAAAAILGQVLMGLHRRVGLVAQELHLQFLVLP